MDMYVYMKIIVIQLLSKIALCNEQITEDMRLLLTESHIPLINKLVNKA